MRFEHYIVTAFVYYWIPRVYPLKVRELHFLNECLCIDRRRWTDLCSVKTRFGGGRFCYRKQSHADCVWTSFRVLIAYRASRVRDRRNVWAYHLRCVILFLCAKPQDQSFLISSKNQASVNERVNLIRITQHTILTVKGLQVNTSNTLRGLFRQLDQKEAN